MTSSYRRVLRADRAVLLPLIAFASSCLGHDAGAPAASDAVRGVEAPVIGGFEADSPTLNAIGSISMRSVDETTGAATLTLQCSGTLIGPRTVLTAKHCLQTFTTATSQGATLVFGLGPDATKPTIYATVLETAGAPGDDGGYGGHGHDVGVLQLDRPLNGVPLVSISDVTDGDVGQKFLVVGYGQQSNSDSTPERRAGSLTLRARTGLTYEAMYGSFETFFKEQAGSLPPTTCPPADQPQPNDLCVYANNLRKLYDTTRLESMQELAAGGLPGDAQPCYGDSGGPLVRIGAQGQLVAYGVVSGGEPSQQLVCDYGGIYASFPPEVSTFLMNAVGWEDPCAGMPAVGQCVGDHARRCSKPAEGHRRIVEADCALAGAHCVTNAKETTCGEPRVVGPEEVDAGT